MTPEEFDDRWETLSDEIREDINKMLATVREGATQTMLAKAIEIAKQSRTTYDAVERLLQINAPPRTLDDVLRDIIRIGSDAITEFGWDDGAKLSHIASAAVEGLKEMKQSADNRVLNVYAIVDETIRKLTEIK